MTLSENSNAPDRPTARDIARASRLDRLKMQKKEIRVMPQTKQPQVDQANDAPPKQSNPDVYGTLKSMGYSFDYITHVLRFENGSMQNLLSQEPPNQKEQERIVRIGRETQWSLRSLRNWQRI